MHRGQPVGRDRVDNVAPSGAGLDASNPGLRVDDHVAVVQAQLQQQSPLERRERLA